MEDFCPFSWHSETRRHSEIKQTRLMNEARLFWGSIVQTKHLRLTSLAFMQLDLGAGRVIIKKNDVFFLFGISFFVLEIFQFL